MAVQNDIRQINRRRLLMESLRRGPASRSELARAIGLSAPTAGKIVDALLAEHVMSEGPLPVLEPVQVGRPRQMVALNGRHGRAAAIQLGAVHTRFAPLHVAPSTTDEWQHEIRTPDSAAKWQAAVTTATSRMFSRRPDVVMISVPGIVDESTGKMLLSPNMHWADGIDVVALVRKALPRTAVHVVHEIHCLALGLLGTEPQLQNFLLVDFGHGVGSTAVVSGKIYRGNLPMIGEIGHTRVAGNGRVCGCGATGCLETLVSRQAIAEAVLGAMTEKRDVSDRWQGVIESVAAGGVNAVLGDALDSAGAGIAGALNSLGIDRVIVTGSLTELPPTALERLAGSIRKHALWARFGTIDIQPRPRRRLAGLSYAMIDRVIAPAA